MKLKVLGSSSKGNAYLLHNKNESLLIECGTHINDIKKALNFDLSKVLGCVVTHEHVDHAKSINKVMESGINVWATEGTHRACGTETHHRARMFSIPNNKIENIGNFKVMPFDIRHDAEEPCGFLINHPETGNVLFLTDTFYCPYTFKGLNNIIIEANYSHESIRVKLNEMSFLKNRIMKSHMSLETCMDFLKANDLSKVNNIVLIHLSDGNSDEAMFKREVKSLTGKTVSVADTGMEVNLNKQPF